MVQEGIIMNVVVFDGSWLVVVGKDRFMGGHREHKTAGVNVVYYSLNEWQRYETFRFCSDSHLQYSECAIYGLKIDIMRTSSAH